MSDALTSTERALLGILWSTPVDSPQGTRYLRDLLNSPERSLFLEDAETQFFWLERVVSWWASLPNIGGTSVPWRTSWGEVVAAVQKRLDDTYPIGHQYEARLRELQQATLREHQVKNEQWTAKERARLEREFGEAEDKDDWLLAHPQVQVRAVEGIAGMLFEEYEIESITVTPLPAPAPPKLPGLPPEYPMAQDFLNVGTPLVLFALFHLCHEAAVDTIRGELLYWTEGNRGEEPAKAAYEVFERALNLLSAVHRSTNGVGWRDGGGAPCLSCSSTSMA